MPWADTFLMFRVFLRISIALCLAVIATALVAWWRSVSAAEMKVAELQQQKHELEQVVGRLSSEARVADVIVTEQTADQTKLLFVEYDRGGKALPAREFTVAGRQVHVDAEVIEFQQDYVMKGDPLRGHAISLFTKLYGDKQAPDSGPLIDTPGDVPRFYRDDETPASSFEADLWQRFWQLEKDADAQKSAGVKVAVGKGVWGAFEPGKLYTITLGADGNLSRKAEPIRGVFGAYIGMLKKAGS